ncbi:MAG: type IX secretion system membrane protein PorP/SprF [Reichenbachiella sp.]
MKSITKIALVVSFALLSHQSLAQQQVMFTQYMFNQLALNPAYAGIHKGISTSFLARHQWAGFEGAPKTQTFSIHSPLKYRAVALGGLLIRDQIGITDQFTASMSYAYRITLSNHTKLSFGLQASLHQFKADFTENANNDPGLAGQNINDLSPNFGAGVMWHTDDFYVGFSVPQLFNHSVGDDLEKPIDPITGEEIEGNNQLIRHYFLTAGYVFTLNQHLKMKPNLLFKWVQGAPFQMDLNLNFLINDLVWLGVSYRSFDSFDALIQLQITPNFQIGYSYDFYTFSDLNKVSNGSHEFMINYVFKGRNNKIVTPRYF